MRTMAGGSVDMVFADPMFNAGKDYAGNLDDDRPEAEYRAWMTDRLQEMVRVLSQGGCMWLMQSQENVGFCMEALRSLGLSYMNIVAWAYANPTPVRHGLPKTWRPILLYSKGPPRYFNAEADLMIKPTLYHNPDRAQSHYPHDLWPDIPKLVGGIFAPDELLTTPDGKFAHLVQMPIAIAIRAILMSTQPGELVLDPFMGSGTMGAGCARTDRRFIGIEIVDCYFDLATERIKRDVTGEKYCPPSKPANQPMLPCIER